MDVVYAGKAALAWQLRLTRKLQPRTGAEGRERMRSTVAPLPPVDAFPKSSAAPACVDLTLGTAVHGEGWERAIA